MAFLFRGPTSYDSEGFFRVKDLLFFFFLEKGTFPLHFCSEWLTVYIRKCWISFLYLTQAVIQMRSKQDLGFPTATAQATIKIS